MRMITIGVAYAVGTLAVSILSNTAHNPWRENYYTDEVKGD